MSTYPSHAVHLLSVCSFFSCSKDTFVTPAFLRTMCVQWWTFFHIVNLKCHHYVELISLCGETVIPSVLFHFHFSSCLLIPVAPTYSLNCPQCISPILPSLACCICSTWGPPATVKNQIEAKHPLMFPWPLPHPSSHWKPAHTSDRILSLHVWFGASWGVINEITVPSCGDFCYHSQTRFYSAVASHILLCMKVSLDFIILQPSVAVLKLWFISTSINSCGGLPAKTSHNTFP